MDSKVLFGEEILFNKLNTYDYSIKVLSETCKFYSASKNIANKYLS